MGLVDSTHHVMIVLTLKRPQGLQPHSALLTAWRRMMFMMGTSFQRGLLSWLTFGNDTT